VYNNKNKKRIIDIYFKLNCWPNCWYLFCL